MCLPCLHEKWVTSQVRWSIDQLMEDWLDHKVDLPHKNTYQHINVKTLLFNGYTTNTLLYTIMLMFLQLYYTVCTTVHTCKLHVAQ